MRERAFRSIKIIKLVQDYFKAKFPKGWDEATQIESFGNLVQQVENLMLSPPTESNAVNSEFDVVIEGIDYEIENVSPGIIRLKRTA